MQALDIYVTTHDLSTAMPSRLFNLGEDAFAARLLAAATIIAMTV
ncbi:hypothetical protein [Pseudomonas sp. Irchel s3a18]|nr:hypothetical protein [Pseudomonas sp. Irchel s3a18]